MDGVKRGLLVVGSVAALTIVAFATYFLFAYPSLISLFLFFLNRAGVPNPRPRLFQDRQKSKLDHCSRAGKCGPMSASGHQRMSARH